MLPGLGTLPYLCLFTVVTWNICSLEMGMAPWHTSGDCFLSLSLSFQPLDRSCFSSGKGALGASVEACCYKRCLQDRLGCRMQQASCTFGWTRRGRFHWLVTDCDRYCHSGLDPLLLDRLMFWSGVCLFIGVLFIELPGSFLQEKVGAKAVPLNFKSACRHYCSTSRCSGLEDPWGSKT